MTSGLKRTYSAERLSSMIEDKTNEHLDPQDLGEPLSLEDLHDAVLDAEADYREARSMVTHLLAHLEKKPECQKCQHRLARWRYTLETAEERLRSAEDAWWTEFDLGLIKTGKKKRAAVGKSVDEVDMVIDKSTAPLMEEVPADVDVDIDGYRVDEQEPPRDTMMNGHEGGWD